MHKNLFAALLLNAALAISFKAIVILDEMDHADNRRTILEDNKVISYTDIPWSIYRLYVSRYVDNINMIVPVKAW